MEKLDKIAPDTNSNKLTDKHIEKFVKAIIEKDDVL